MIQAKTCYCYNEECNQKKWEELGKEGKRQYTVIEDIYIKGKKVPQCPYCKETMTVTASLGINGDYE